MKVKDDFLRLEKLNMREWTQIKFWEDKWLGNSSPKDRFPNLYNIVQKKKETVNVVLTQSL